jgi:carbamoyl-phosphate synthase large subunit
LDRLVAVRDVFESRGILLMAAPQAMIATCRDKLATGKALLELGFDPPRFASLNDFSDIAVIDWYPVVVKPQRAGGGSKDCYIAQTPRELELLFELAGRETGLFVQEYVGTPENEFTVGVLLDLEGKLINSIALRRDLTYQLNLRVVTQNRTGDARFGDRLVISSGISQGTIDAFPDVTGPCEKIALAIGATGAINVQCRRVEDKIKVFEINPRFSGTTFIRAMMGYNEPSVLIRRHLFGEMIAPHFFYRRGHIIRSLRESLVSERSVQSWNVERGS